MVASPEACRWSGIPALGDNLLARLPRSFSGRKQSFPGLKTITIPVAFSPCGERAFVPITAAGQRGIYTPLPRFHPLKILLNFYHPGRRMSMSISKKPQYIVH
jgi:hypothetical protein